MLSMSFDKIEEEVRSISNELKELCFEAGQAIMDIYDRGLSDNAIIKEDGSPLTNADLSSNEIIIAGLNKLTPHIPVLSEESRNSFFGNSDCFWLVDPLDGTKEFINRNGEFTVNIALIEKGLPVFGFVYTPVLTKLYYGDVNSQTAMLYYGEKLKQAIPLQTKVMEKPLLRVLGSRSHQKQDTLDELLRGNKYTILQCGSSLKFCLIAEGKSDIYPRLGPTMIWDTGAGHAVLKAAGGSVKSLIGEELRYNPAQLMNPYFLARS